MHSYDLFCLSETWLDSTTSIDYNDFSLKCYNLYRVENPENFKKAPICVYYKETYAVYSLQTKLKRKKRSCNLLI